MEDIIDIIVTETTNLIEITSQPTDEIIDVNIIDNREDVTLNVTPTLVEININSLTGNFGVNWGDIEGTLSNQTDLQNALNLKADLVDGKVPSSQLPSYVDDVVEVANYAALPATGEVGKIYITLDTNYIYRWTGSTYVEIKDSSAVWGAITGTLSNQTDLQNALNAKANDNVVVHLAGTETITGAKTFSSAVTAPNFVLSGGTGNTGLYYGHTDRVVLANYTTGGIDFEVNGGSIVATLFPSGNYGLGITLDAGYKLDVNGTARISGALSGTSASFSSSITASSIIKSGGTSSQFLKADGSVDSNTYLTTSSAASTYVSGSGVTDYYARFTGTKVIADGFIRTTSNITYVEGMGLSTGNGLDIQGNYGAGGGGLKIRSYDETTGNAYIDFANTGGRMYLGLNRSTTGGLMTNATAYATVLTTGLGTSNLEFGTNATKRMTIDGTTGAVTLTSALSGTSATFTTGLIVSNTSDVYPEFKTSAVDADAFLGFSNTGDGNAAWSIGRRNTGEFWISTYTGNFNSGTRTQPLVIATSGAATFSSSVTTGGTITIGGPSRLSSVAGNGLNFAIDGSDKMFINTNGNVGIGTTSPDAIFHVAKVNSGGLGGQIVIDNPATSTLGNSVEISFLTDAGASGAGTRNARIIAQNENAGNGAANMQFWTWNGGTDAERMRITSGGNVGIGTSSPMTFGSFTNLTIASSATNNYSAIFLVNSSVSIRGSWYQNGGNQINFGTATAHPLVFDTSDVERMRITSGGNVGIGLTNPSGQLSIKNQISNGANPISSYAATNGVDGQNFFNGYYASNSDGVGTYPRYFDIVSIGSPDGSNGGSNIRFFTNTQANNSAAVERMRITSGGSIGIGGGQDVNNAILDKLSLGHYSTYGWIQTWNATNLYLNKVGNAVYAGTQRIDNNSDARIKTNIQNIENALETVLSLSGKKFNMLDENNILRYGFIAQEVQPHLNDFVTQSDRKFEKDNLKIENLLTLESSGSAWGALLVEAIKEQQAQIQELKEQLANK